MSNVPSDEPRISQRKPGRATSNGSAIANAVGVVLDARDGEQGFPLPGRLFEQLPFAVYVCDRDGLVLRYNGRAAELWGRSPKLRDPDTVLWLVSHVSPRRQFASTPSMPDGRRPSHRRFRAPVGSAHRAT
ncbi:PAS domain-containing protein [Bradyrhizobium sp. ma5]|uniref:PAS domain-containing protein n=1 Tax=Bradyrhizobium sp. ma5 TaxID=3344828 RepID=UPI0035D4FC28